ncbi:uncharacterized protein LOC123549959 [Mercenaria mercenaria]|uniref:uncharacterized protein LOC123549959 n=1 Tax=Mercenaria mercenaria TaxID=6596 RepID=UPI00234F83FA|nr:uncharacterized protein LOC123549959 [Mercenaria mercenaria]
MSNHIMRNLIFVSYLLMNINGLCSADNAISDAVGPPVTTSKPSTTMSSIVKTANGSPLYFSETQTPKGEELISTTGASNHNSVEPPGSRTSTHADGRRKSTETQSSSKTVQGEITETATMHTYYLTTNTLPGLFTGTQGAHGPPTSGSPDPVSSNKHTTSEISSGSSKSLESSGSPVFTVSNQSPPAAGPPAFTPPGLTGPQGYSNSSQAHGPPAFAPTGLMGLQGPNNSSQTHGPPAAGPIATTGFTLIYNRNPKNTSDAPKTTQNMYYKITTNAPILWIDRPYLFDENFDLVDFIKSVCPYTKSCREENKANVIETYDSCCSKCDCSDECFAKGNCCYDKEMPMHMNYQKTPMSSLNESCVFPTYGHSNIQALLDFNKKSVLMIDHCPKEKDAHGQQGNQSLSESSCEYSGLAGILSILDLAPVYSSEKLVSYTNQHCAMCNAASQSLVPWNRTTLTCHFTWLFVQLFDFSTSIESFLQNLKQTGCIMEFHSPNHNSVECLHQDALISDCDDNFSFLFKPKIRDYCKNITIPFGRGGNLYKNVFCFGCNEFKGNIHDFACESYTSGYGYDFGNPEAEIDVNALEEGLLKQSQNKSEMVLDKMCAGEEGFIYNRYMNQCLTYVCAPSKVNVSGQCLSVIKSLKNVAFDYKVTYRFIVGTVSYEKYLYEDKTIKMMTNNNIVNICRRKIKTTASLRDYHVTYDTLLSRLITEMTHIENEFSGFKQRYESVVNRSEKIELNIDHSGYEFLPLGQIDFIRFKGMESVNECPEGIAMVDLQFCDAVMFRIISDQRDSEGMLVINALKFKPSEYLVRLQPVNDTLVMYAQICSDLFSRKLEALEDNTTITSSTIITSYRPVLMLCCIIFSVTRLI